MSTAFRTFPRIALSTRPASAKYPPPTSPGGNFPLPWCLPCCVATVDHHVLTRHERRGVAQHEEGGATILLGVADAAEHVALLPLGAQGWVVLEVGLDHRGEDVARAEDVHTDGLAVDLLAPFHGEAAAELNDGALGGVVNGTEEILVGDQAAHGADQDHAAWGLVFLHLASAAARGEVNTLEVDVHHLFAISK